MKRARAEKKFCTSHYFTQGSHPCVGIMFSLGVKLNFLNN